MLIILYNAYFIAFWHHNNFIDLTLLLLLVFLSFFPLMRVSVCAHNIIIMVDRIANVLYYLNVKFSAFVHNQWIIIGNDKPAIMPMAIFQSIEWNVLIWICICATNSVSKTAIFLLVHGAYKHRFISFKNDLICNIRHQFTNDTNKDRLLTKQKKKKENWPFYDHIYVLLLFK